MKKTTAILSLVALAMSTAILSSCSKKPEQKPQEDENVYREVSREEYMAALEGKSRSDESYEICLLNGKLSSYTSSGPITNTLFLDEPIRFLDSNTPSVSPKYDLIFENNIRELIMKFASDFTDGKYYLKKDGFKVVSFEFVATDKASNVSYEFNSFGYPISVKNGTAYDSSSSNPAMPGLHPEIVQMKDLTFAWSEKDTIGSYSRISRADFLATASQYENSASEYKTGYVSGKFRKIGQDNVTTLQNEPLVSTSSGFESVNFPTELSELKKKASTISDGDAAYYYFSDSEHSLMIVAYDVPAVACYRDREMKWNDGGHVTAIKDTISGYETEVTETIYAYDLSAEYSKE